MITDPPNNFFNSLLNCCVTNQNSIDYEKLINIKKIEKKKLKQNQTNLLQKKKTDLCMRL